MAVRVNSRNLFPAFLIMPVVMALKGVDYEYRAVNLIKDGGEQKREEYVRNQNPMGEVPTFVDGDTVLTQVKVNQQIRGCAIWPKM